MFCREEILAFVEVCFRNFGDRVKQFWSQLQFSLQEWWCGGETFQIWWLSGRCASSSPFSAKSSMSNQIVSASWFLSLFVVPLVFYVLVVLFPPFRFVFWTALWFWPLVGGCKRYSRFGEDCLRHIQRSQGSRDCASPISMDTNYDGAISSCFAGLNLSSLNNKEDQITYNYKQIISVWCVTQIIRHKK